MTFPTLSRGVRRSRATRSLQAWLLGLLMWVTPGAAQEGVLPDTLDIERAVGIALTQSPQLRISQARADQAGADRLAAWGSFLPTADVNLNLNRSSFTKSTFLGEEGLSQTLPEPLSSSQQSAGEGLSFGWTLLDGGRRFATLRQTAANVTAAQRRYDDEQRTVIVSVHREFLEALRRQRLLDLTGGQIADRQLELDIARRRYEIAAVERTDVLAAELNLLNAQISLLGERQQLESGLRGLSVAMGLPPEVAEGVVLAGETGVPEGALDIDRLAQVAMTSDPELAALEAERAAAAAGLWGARTNYLPRIVVGLSFRRSEQFGLNQSFFQFDLGDTARGFSITASWNLFNGFGREQENAQASAAKRTAEENLRSRRLELERDVRGFGAQIDQLSQTIALLERAFAISQERLDMEQERYRVGTGSFIALQQAINAAQSAETSLIQRQYDYLIAWSNLEEYMGGSR